MIPDSTVVYNGVTVKKKIIPDSTRWIDDNKEANEEYEYEDGSSYTITHSAYSNTKRTEPEAEYIIE